MQDHLQIEIVLFFPFPVWMPFISSSRLIAMAGIPTTILTTSGESTVLALILGGNAFGHTVCQGRFFVGGLYLIEEVPSYS